MADIDPELTSRQRQPDAFINYRSVPSNIFYG